jgi:DNA-binding NtrC family response regulator
VAEDDTRTHPRHLTGLPVKTLRVTVVEGPERGAAKEAPEDTMTVGTAEGSDLTLSDRAVSRYHLELRRRGARILVTDLGSTNGTLIGNVLLQKSHALVAPGTTLRIGDTTLRIDDGQVVMVDAAPPDAFEDLLGRSPAMRRLLADVARVATTTAPVLLVGESGSGKEVIARAIHALWNKQRPLVTVDCAATTPTLFASELFGHERGAFTGAERRREGAFAEANGGMLFLDEIGELPLDIQTTLLGVLERRRFRRLGASSDASVDVRIISATNRDLRAEVNESRFRLDLYFRLAVVTLFVPPLRERKEDVPLLVEHFLRLAGYDGSVEAIFPPDRMASLVEHSWPGNVRELRNVVEATLVMGTPPGPLGAAAPSNPTAVGGEAPPTYKQARREVLDRFERDYLTTLLTHTGGNVRHASRVAQMDRSYLMKLLKDHGLG